MQYSASDVDIGAAKQLVEMSGSTLIDARVSKQFYDSDNVYRYFDGFVAHISDAHMPTQYHIVYPADSRNDEDSEHMNSKELYSAFQNFEILRTNKFFPIGAEFRKMLICRPTGEKSVLGEITDITLDEYGEADYHILYDNNDVEMLKHGAVREIISSSNASLSTLRKNAWHSKRNEFKNKVLIDLDARSTMGAPTAVMS